LHSRKQLKLIAAVEELPDRPISEHPNDVTKNKKQRSRSRRNLGHQFYQQ
jgi:hypothetical protein